LHKYTSAAAAISILGTSSLRWSSPLLFNDPFDVPRNMELPFTADELKAATAARIQEYLDGRAQPAPDTPFASFGSLAKGNPRGRELMSDIVKDSLPLLSIPYELAIAEFRAAWEEKVRVLRIACFSAVGHSPAMWAHYGDDHRGVVLQFESNDERDSSFLLATPVTYRAERPSLPVVHRWVRTFLGEEEVDWNEYFREYYYVKSEDWANEQEYRAISASPEDEGLVSDRRFAPEDLRGVVLGSSIRPEDESVIRRLSLGYPNADLYRAQLDTKGRRVAYVPWEPE
jgi:hypothetical protein